MLKLQARLWLLCTDYALSTQIPLITEDRHEDWQVRFEEHGVSGQGCRLQRNQVSTFQLCVCVLSGLRICAGSGEGVRAISFSDL